MRVGDIVRCNYSGNNPNGGRIGDGEAVPYGYGLRGERYRVVELRGENGVLLRSLDDETHGRGARDRFEVVQEGPAQPAPQPRPARRPIGEQFTMWVIVWRNAVGGLSQSTYTTEQAARSKVRSLELDDHEILLRKKLTFDL